jgi:hypothetical protein
MPSYNLTQQAKVRDRARRIREVSASFRRERITRNENVSDIRRALQSTSASEFVSTEVLV